MRFFGKPSDQSDHRSDGSSSNESMIQTQIVGRGITTASVVDALRRTDRKDFAPETEQAHAYEDRPLALMPGSTVSQPYMVALMTDLLRVGSQHRVLEIGTGSGYQAAVLSRLAQEVYTVEMQPELVEYARVRLRDTGRDNVMIVEGDGWKGYEGAAPYDRILVTAAPASVPQALLDQLAPGGRMVAPIGGTAVQELEIFEKSATGVVSRTGHSSVQFVPLVSRQPDDVEGLGA